MPMSRITLMGATLEKIAVPAYPLLGGLQKFQYLKYSEGNSDISTYFANRLSSILISLKATKSGLCFFK